MPAVPPMAGDGSLSRGAEAALSGNSNSGFPSVSALSASRALACWSYSASQVRCSVLEVNGTDTVTASSALIGSTLSSGSDLSVYSSRPLVVSVAAFDASNAVVCLSLIHI